MCSPCFLMSRKQFPATVQTLWPPPRQLQVIFISERRHVAHHFVIFIPLMYLNPHLRVLYSPFFFPANACCCRTGRPVISRMSAAAVSWRLLFVLSLISQTLGSSNSHSPHPHCTSSPSSDHTLCMLRPCAPTSQSGCCACERSVTRWCWWGGW